LTVLQADQNRSQKREDTMQPTPTRARATALLCTLFAATVAFTALPKPASAADVPTFAVDASWPKPLPNNWILGQVGGITVDW
jgi:hypothetical protein